MMKRFLLLCSIVLLPFLMSAQSTNRTPLNRAFLQSNMDGNGKSITNAFFVGDGSGLTGIPGAAQTNISWIAITNLTSAEMPYSVITNPPAGLAQTNISYTAVTNAPWQWADANLTNWATLTTNVLMSFGQTNIDYTAVTNAPWQYGSANLTNWSQLATNYVPPNSGTSTYSSLLTSTGIGLADTNYVNNLVASINQHYYFSSVTNALGVGVSTNCSTMIDTPVAAAATNSIAVPTAGVYFLSRVSTNTVTRIEEGPIHLQTYVYITGGALVQTVTAHPEIWIWFTNDTMVQIATSAAQVFTEGTGNPVIFNTTMNVSTATNLPAGSHLLLRWYADAVANSPTWNFVIGGNYDSHISVNVPVSSATINASQIVSGGQITLNALATNTPSANQVLTATSASSAAWQDKTVKTVGISVDGGGSAITAGTKGFISVPYAGSINGCVIMAQPSGSIEFRIWRTNSADGSFPPTAVGAIGTNSLTADNYNVDSTLSGWTTALSAGDVLAFNIPSAATTITNCTLQLKIQP